MKRLNSIILILTIAASLQGCAALGWLSSLSGGGSKSGGVDVTANTAIGDNKKKVQIGHEQSLDHNEGIVAGEDAYDYGLDSAESVQIHHERSWVSELQGHITIILVVALCFSVILILVALFMRSPKDRRRVDFERRRYEVRDKTNKDTLELLVKSFLKNKS